MCTTPLVFLSLVVSSFAIQCLDQNQNPVDWWIAFKFGADSKKNEDGYTYAYADSNQPSKFVINDFHNTSAIYYTVSQLGLYGGSADQNSVGWVMWNDQTHSDLDGKCDNHEQDDNGDYYAHAKGLLGFDQKTGFWLDHSAPGFPYSHDICPNYWYYPRAQAFYAQNFFCVSIDSRDLDKIAEYLKNFHAYIYDNNIPSSISTSSLEDLVAGKFYKKSAQITFDSLNGQSFHAIGKNGATDSDLFEDYVAPALSTDLLVQSWCGGIYGKRCQPSYCAGSPISDPSTPQKDSSTYQYDSVDIESVNFNGHSYLNSQNHAKWAIALSNDRNAVEPYYCAADNNRQSTQRKRGGGALCLSHSSLYSTMRKVVGDVNTTCSK